MGRTLKPKERAKMIHKRFKACSYNSELYIKRFSPDKSKFEDYEIFIYEINLYNKFFGYLARINL